MSTLSTYYTVLHCVQTVQYSTKEQRRKRLPSLHSIRSASKWPEHRSFRNNNNDNNNYELIITRSRLNGRVNSSPCTTCTTCTPYSVHYCHSFIHFNCQIRRKDICCNIQGKEIRTVTKKIITRISRGKGKGKRKG